MCSLSLSLSFSLMLFFKVLEVECSCWSIQLGIQSLAWMIKSFHLSAMPLRSFLTVMFGVEFVSCVIATAMAPWPLLRDIKCCYNTGSKCACHSPCTLTS